jgi:hypothetical protein
LQRGRDTGGQREKQEKQAAQQREERDKSRNREVTAQYGKAKKKRGQQNLAEEQNKEQSRGS